MSQNLKLTVMKTIVSLFICFMVILVSCKKEETPKPSTSNTRPTQSNWYDDYTDGGVLPNNTATNPLMGTKWVLTKYITGGLVMQYPNDTLTFSTYNKYKVNQGGERTYSLSAITGSTNKTLTLNFFSSFGGSNYAGVVGAYFINDGFINNAEFSDMQNSTIRINAWFIKF